MPDRALARTSPPALGGPAAAFSGEELYRGLILLDGPAADRIPEIRDQIRPPLDLGNSRLARAVSLFQDQLIDALKARDPRFFESFASEIRSGDHLRVQSALVEAARATAEILRDTAAVRAVGRDLREDPRRLQDLLASLKESPEAASLTDEQLLDAVGAVVSLSVADAGTGQSPYTVDASIVAVIVTVAAVVAAITVVLAQSYAAVLNIAGAVNFYLAIVATTYVYASGGGGGGKRRKTSATLSLVQEQMVDSIVTAFGS